MKRAFSLVICSLLAGCASAPMAPDIYSSHIASQKRDLGLESRCCLDYLSLDPVNLDNAQQLAITASAQVAMVRNSPLPVLAFELPSTAGGKRVEVFSFGEKKGGSLRLDRVIFIKPQYVFLDAQRKTIGSVRSSPVCWGDFDWNSLGVWNSAVVPASARFLIISPDLSTPRQLVDTRRFSSSPVADAIAEARKSYLSEVNFGYMGELSARVLDSSAVTRSKQCVIEVNPAS